MYKYILSATFLLFLQHELLAQRDTTRKQSIDITSSYKPVLRNAIKINFSGSQLPADTSRPSLQYNIPAQNLFYAYQPISLRPLALEQDTNLYLGVRNYIKAGFGSYTTPYVNAGFGFGDGKTSLVNLYGNYISSKGNELLHQDYAIANLKATGSYFGTKNEVYGTAEIKQQQYYLYGYDQKLLSFTKDQLSQKFQEFSIAAGLRNTITTPYRLSYNPNFSVNFFTNTDKLSETTVKINLPVEKRLGESYSLHVEGRADFTNYSTQNQPTPNIKIGNNLIELAPAIRFAAPRMSFNAGISPVWNDGDFDWIPNIYLEAQLAEKVFMVQAGWVGRYIKNSYRNLSSLNPYLLPINSIVNTREVEHYGGIKASLANHFNISAKASWITYKNMPLFINDTATDMKGFLVSNESRMNNLRLHGNVSYVNQDKFTLTAGLTLNGYTGMVDNAKAWHTLPIEFNGSLRWWAFERFMLKGDFRFFNGGNYLAKQNKSFPLSGGTDLSAGAEYKINKQFSAWLDVNNILNDKYERWNNYQVYGINVLGGILINF